MNNLKNNIFQKCNCFLYTTFKRPFRTLTLENINPNIKNMDYKIRGGVYIRAQQIQKEMDSGIKKPYPYLISASSDDSQATHQKPLTFFRQAMSAAIYPELLNSKAIPDDVKKRSKDIMALFANKSMGSYTDATGSPKVRAKIAEYLTLRDGIKAYEDDIILTSGITDGVKKWFSMLKGSGNGKKNGVLVPIPQYPIYKIELQELGMYVAKYYLDEKVNWNLNTVDLRRAITEARQHCNLRGMVVINPNNPTGVVLDRKTMEDIIKICYDEKLILFADEAYQDLVLTKKKKFLSFKKVMMEMGEPVNRRELVSFFSLSTGYYGEAGSRGAFLEFINFYPAVKAQFFKLCSVFLCSSTYAQALVYCICHPPQKGEPSYATHQKEINDILESIKRKVTLTQKVLNSLPGLQLHDIEGGIFAYPRIQMPLKAIEAAKKANMPADVLYCMRLLEEQGVICAPGSMFSQKPGTYHLRLTFLQAKGRFSELMERISIFHNSFMSKYA